MSGHSKWSKIKRKKQANDQDRGKIFSKLSRLITLAVIQGGGITDPDGNVKLRLAVEKARQLNMPKENVKRAIDRGTGPQKQQLTEVVYEAFACGGAALIILATTDNHNRTLTEIKNVLERNGGKLGNKGTVAYLFDRCGLVTFNKKQANEENILEFMSRISALDFDQDSQYYYVYIPFEFLGRVKNSLGKLVAEAVEIDYKPKASVAISDKEQARILTLIELLDELDDVHNVFANFDVVGQS